MSSVKLNPQQQEAVDHTDGPLLILAGAGSGKTGVITYKIAHLVTNKIYAPNQILAVTFTKKAALEMNERVEKLLNLQMTNSYLPEKNSIFIGTFHSLGASILRQHGDKVNLERNFSIYDDTDRISLIKKIYKDLDISEQVIKPRVALNKINTAKMSHLHPADFVKKSQNYADQQVAKIYTEYAKRLHSLNAVDFNDLLWLPWQLLKNNADVLQFYRDKFRYVLVDEYQDTNQTQYEIIRLLTKKHQNLCAVGDEDQSIYSWRGATIENIRNFQKDFSKAKIIKLERNYRSTQKILDAANQVISKNPNRVIKKLWTDLTDNNLIRIYEGYSEKDEAQFIIRQLDLMKRAKIRGTVAVLYRTNVLSRTLEDTFVRHNIPHQVVGGVGFYERMEIKDLLAYLRFINNARDEISLLRIINTPPRKIGAQTIIKLREYAQQAGYSLAEFCWIGGLTWLHAIDHEKNKIKQFTDTNKEQSLLMIIKELKSQIQQLLLFFGLLIDHSFDNTTASLLTYITKKSKYIDWLRNSVDNNDELNNRLDNLQELNNLATQSSISGRDALATFLEDISLITVSKKNSPENNIDNGYPLVNLMTIHAAKGLEFDIVFVVGMEEGLFPHSRAYADVNQLEEERRLCYVAITRARRLLYLTHVTSRTIYGSVTSQAPSRYLEDISPELTQRL